ncbi:hypothetical protein L2V44_14295, partial [Staphylococcus aureus]|nr:hypothetical protein [Staphylococcus aureus]
LEIWNLNAMHNLCDYAHEKLGNIWHNNKIINKLAQKIWHFEISKKAIFMDKQARCYNIFIFKERLRRLDTNSESMTLQSCHKRAQNP